MNASELAKIAFDEGILILVKTVDGVETEITYIPKKQSTNVTYPRIFSAAIDNIRKIVNVQKGFDFDVYDEMVCEKVMTNEIYEYLNKGFKRVTM